MSAATGSVPTAASPLHESSTETHKQSGMFPSSNSEASLCQVDVWTRLCEPLAECGDGS
jgi:hypothetical protein